jgi:putative mRNA 3-end processing factor
VNILLTGWEFNSPYRRVGLRDWIVSFSDHADFDQLLEYVLDARPRVLVVDAFRGGEAARIFASYVSREHGIKAHPQP